MDIKEIALAKNQLEKDITIAVSKLVETFKQDTGLTPNSIYIDMATVDIFNAPLSDNVICGCSCEIKI